MLSTENPQPDLSCTLQNSQLKSVSCVNSDEENSGKCQLDQVDLLDQSPVLDDNNSLPNFSIRDYVFSERRKDIKTNWPFSKNTLQLCLKHDLKDVLPPFQSIDSIKNPSLDKSSDSDTRKSSFRYNVGWKIVADAEKIDSNRSEKHKEHPKATDLETKAETSQRKKSAVAVQETESINPKPGKKCKLIVKLKVAEPKSKEVLSLNNCGVSDPMSSKVCPVCKTFSSSSNTTLNAHIDRCLSGESTVKWTENPKSVKHRIKPRKTKLIVDIYSTALSCTLEDLDRRNGTTWASNVGLTGQELDVCVEEKKGEMSTGNIGNGNEESAVYIDSNGTKVRILSKFNDLPSSSNVKDDSGANKILKKDKPSKILCIKKKKNLVDKATVSKSVPEINNGKQREVSIEENLTETRRTCYQINSDDLGMIKPWVSSKRTGVRKKMTFEHKKQDRTVKNLSNTVSLDKLVKRTEETNSSILCDENPRLRKRKDNLPCKSHDRGENLQNEPEDHVSSRNFEKISQRFSSDGPCVSLRMPHESLSSYRDNEFAFTKKSSLEGKKFSSLRENLLSGKSKKLEKSLNFKNKLRYALKADVESSLARQDNIVGTPSNNSALKRKEIDKLPITTMPGVSKIQKRNVQFTSKRQKSSDISDSDSYETGASLGGMKDIESVSQPTSRIADEEAFTAFTKSLDSSFPASANPLDAECVSRHFTKSYEENVQPELNLRGEQEDFSVEKVGKYLVSQSTDFVAEIDDNGGNGNYIVDVEPIPIPGPPGSFLPSPGRMGSEELPGSSSLTTCKIQSSEDEHELVVDMHSSGSSQTSSSLMSSFVPARSCSVSFTRFSDKSHFERDVSENRINAEGMIKLADSRTNFMLNETPSFRSNNEPCCCSRKEGVVQSGSSNYHDSQLSSQHSLPHENSVMYPSLGFVPEGVSLSSAANSQACEPPSPLSPNPVLRLMGKNLVVMNKDEIQQSNVENGGNMHNNVLQLFHQSSSQDSRLFENVQRRIPTQHDFSSSHGFKVPTVPRMVQSAPRPSTVMFSNKTSMDCNMMPDQMRFSIPEDLSSRKHDDMTALNGSAKNESCIASKPTFRDLNMEPCVSSAQMAWGYDSRHVNPNCDYTTMGYPLCSGSRVSNVNPQVLQNGKNADLAEWIYAQENPHSLAASSPSAGHLRSPMYFSPSFP